MAIGTKFGTSDLFLTYTCNPKHPDIVNNLGNDYINLRTPLTPSDRADIVASVFKLHLDELKRDLKVIFGTTLANLHVIEYQKRGLPHAHILIWLHSEYKLRTPADIDRFICAEIPDPNFYELYQIITSCMMHGPCGNANRQ